MQSGGERNKLGGGKKKTQFKKNFFHQKLKINKYTLCKIII